CRGCRRSVPVRAAHTARLPRSSTPSSPPRAGIRPAPSIRAASCRTPARRPAATVHAASVATCLRDRLAAEPAAARVAGSPPASTVAVMTNPPFGFALPGGSGEPNPNDPAQLQAFLSQLQQLLMNTGGGPVNWDLAKQVAQSQLRDDPAVATPQRDAVVEALRLADLWLDPITPMPTGIRSAVAWRRAD